MRAGAELPRSLRMVRRQADLAIVIQFSRLSGHRQAKVSPWI